MKNINEIKREKLANKISISSILKISYNFYRDKFLISKIQNNIKKNSSFYYKFKKFIIFI